MVETEADSRLGDSSSFVRLPDDGADGTDAGTAAGAKKRANFTYVSLNINFFNWVSEYAYFQFVIVLYCTYEQLAQANCDKSH